MNQLPQQFNQQFQHQMPQQFPQQPPQQFTHQFPLPPRSPQQPHTHMPLIPQQLQPQNQMPARRSSQYQQIQVQHHQQQTKIMPPTIKQASPIPASHNEYIQEAAPQQQSDKIHYKEEYFKLQRLVFQQEEMINHLKHSGGHEVVTYVEDSEKVGQLEQTNRYLREQLELLIHERKAEEYERNANMNAMAERELFEMRDYMEQKETEHRRQIRQMQEALDQVSSGTNEQYETKRKLNMLVEETAKLNQALKGKIDENEQLKLRVREQSKNQQEFGLYQNEQLQLRQLIDDLSRENNQLKQELNYIAELEQKLLIVTGELDRANGVLRIANDENDRLKVRVRQMEEGGSKSSGLQQQVDKMEMVMQQKNDQIRSLQRELEQASNALGQKNHEMQHLMMEQQHLVNVLNEKSQECDEQRRLISKMKQELISARSESEQGYALRKEIERLSEMLRVKESDFEQMRRRVVQMESEFGDSQEQEMQMQSLLSQLEELRLKLESATQTIQRLQDRCSDYEFVHAENRQYEVRMRDLEQTVSVLEQEQGRLKELIRVRTGEVETLKVDAQQLQLRVNRGGEQTTMVSELKVQVEQWKSKCQRLEGSMSEMRREETNKQRTLQNELDQWRAKYDKLQDEFRRDDEGRKYQGEISGLKSVIQRLELRLKGVEEEWSAKVRQLNAETENYKLKLVSQNDHQGDQKLNEERQKNSRLMAELEQLKRRAQELTLKISTQQQIVEPSGNSNEIRQLKEALNNRLEEVEMWKRKYDQAVAAGRGSTNNERYEREIMEMRSVIKDYERQIQTLNKRQQTTTTTMVVDDGQLDIYKKEIERLKATINEQRLQLNQYGNKINDQNFVEQKLQKQQTELETLRMQMGSTYQSRLLQEQSPQVVVTTTRQQYVTKHEDRR